MKKMTDMELLSLVNSAEKDAVKYNGEFTAKNDELLDRYLSEPYGDETEFRSQVISNDVFDLVEADMPSLARIFLSSSDTVKFTANTSNEEDIAEAEEKTEYIKHIINTHEDSYRIQFSWLKGSELQTCSVLQYGIDESKKTQTKKYDGINEIELAEYLEEARADHDKVEIIGQDQNDDGSYYLEIRYTDEQKKPFFINVPYEDFIISRGAETKDKALIVGTRSRRRRGDLIKDGYDAKLVKSLPSDDNSDEYGTKNDRHRQEGGIGFNTSGEHWATEEITVSDLYMLVDYDNDGIPERRHIVKVGNEILENEPFDHVPFAIMSSILMPHKLIGKARAETVLDTQRTQTVIQRQILDNLYKVNNTKHVIHDDVDIDDMLTDHIGGIVRSGDEILPAQAVAPLMTEYVGDKALQIAQYIDSKRAATTGSLMSNQGLTADDFGKETATRFEGVEASGRAKIELVARVLAETGYKQLYEGLAWFVSHYQDDEAEFQALGKTLTVSPSKWKFDHRIETQVGLGVGDSEKTAEHMAGFLNISERLAQSGSVTVDDKKIYNILARLTKSMGYQRPSEFWNDPEQPEELLLAENALMKAQLESMNQPNPLAEAEKIKAEKDILIMQEKHKLEMIKLQAKFEQETQKHMDDITAKFTELELKYGVDVPRSAV